MEKSEFEKELRRMGYYSQIESRTGIMFIINTEDDAISASVNNSKILFCGEGPNRPWLRWLLEKYFQNN